jgi:hypothetical protein
MLYNIDLQGKTKVTYIKMIIRDRNTISRYVYCYNINKYADQFVNENGIS